MKEHLELFKNEIKKNSDKIWLPKGELNYKEIKTNSWFDIKISKNAGKSEFEPDVKSQPETANLRRCFEVILKLNERQKEIIQRWNKAYTLVYNETVKYIKHNISSDNKEKLKDRKIRFILKDVRDDIKNKSMVKGIKNSNIKTHILDTAIKLACTNYNSALTNLNRKNIKHFRMRYWRHDRESRVMEFENSFFRNGTICKNPLGKVNAFRDGEYFDLKKIEDEYKVGCKIKYDKIKDKYIMYVPEKVEQRNLEKKNKYISLDPGIRTFQTGVSEDGALKIGNHVIYQITKYLKRIDNCELIKSRITRKRKEKEKLYMRKIKNKIDDLHWKTIKYLTSKYKTIIIGDMSVQSIVKSMKDKMLKRIAYVLKFYQFKQKLEYKCKLEKVNYKMQNESYTSCVCSNCGWKNEKLGKSKKFECKECKINIDRDINGSRGILIKTKIKK
jgi:IS605 OrfB family transposase